MHILTKIFVVLVSVLAIALVPLVVVQGSNEAAVREKYLAEKASAAAAHQSLESARNAFAQVESALQTQLKEAEVRLGQSEAAVEERQARIRTLESERGALAQAKAGLEANIEVLAEADRARTELVATLHDELTALRAQLLQAERERVDMETALAKLTVRFEAQTEQVKQLKEEAQRQKEVTERAATAIAVARPGDTGHRVADRDVRATITEVHAADGVTWAAINQGSNAGVQVGWRFSIADSQNRFVGDLMVERVQPDSAVGKVVYHAQGGRGSVAAVDQAAIAQRGR